MGEACPWCFRRPSLHRLCGLERASLVKFAPFTRFTSDLRGMIGNPVDSTCLRVAPNPDSGLRPILIKEDWNSIGLLSQTIRDEARVGLLNGSGLFLISQ